MQDHIRDSRCFLLTPLTGHLLSTAEVESALVEHEAVAEAAVVGRPHPVKGESLYCFVTLSEGVIFSRTLEAELRRQGAWLRPTGSLSSSHIDIGHSHLRLQSGSMFVKVVSHPGQVKWKLVFASGRRWSKF